MSRDARGHPGPVVAPPKAVPEARRLTATYGRVGGTRNVAASREHGGAALRGHPAALCRGTFWATPQAREIAGSARVSSVQDGVILGGPKCGGSQVS
jgi:hypothetical protein